MSSITQVWACFELSSMDVPHLCAIKPNGPAQAWREADPMNRYLMPFTLQGGGIEKMNVKIIDAQDGSRPRLEITFGFVIQAVDLDEAEADAYRILTAVNQARARVSADRMAKVVEGRRD